MMTGQNTLVGATAIPENKLRIDIILDGLAMCESANRSDVIVLDTNGRYSYGRYQFQALTVKHYAIKYGLLPDDLELQDYANWALDPDFARILAKKILLDGDWQNWLNCLKNKNLSNL